MSAKTIAKKKDRKKHKTHKGLSDLQARVAKGEPEAEYELGMRHLHGEDVEKNGFQAMVWLNKAALNNHIPAQLALVELLRGEGPVTQDLALAFEWATRAANAGDTQAQLILGTMYKKGEGVAPDMAQAVSWIQRSADAGNLDATMYLGLLYATPGDYHAPGKAMELILEAGEASHSYALSFLARAYWNGFHGICEKDDRKAFAWAKLAAKNEPDAKNMIILFHLYNEGVVVNRNPKKALRSLLLACEMTDDPCYQEACLLLGDAYSEGEIVTTDDEMAAHYYEIASQKEPIASLKYAHILYYGLGVEVDHHKALEHYMIAYQSGLSSVAHEIGLYYEQGLIVRQDFQRAVYYYEVAIANGFYEAAFDLSQLYWRGLGVPRDMDKAYKLMSLIYRNAITLEEKQEIEVLLEKILDEMTLKEYNAHISSKRLPIPADYDPKHGCETLH